MDFESELGLFNENDRKIRLTRAKFNSSTTALCEELFSGFDELRVITYSYGLDFVRDIVKNFSYAEMIVGNERLIDKKLAEVMLHQEYNINFAKVIYNQTFVCDYIKENDYLIGRVRDGSFRVFTPQDLCSHQKIYLLRANDGRTRTILGSANFSYRAWNNDQLEEFICFEEKEAYDFYFEKFDILKEMSTDEISINAFEAKTDIESLEELQIFKVVNAKNSIVLKSDAVIESDTVLRTNNLNNQIFDALKSVKVTVDKQGKTLVETKDVQVFFNELKSVKKAAKEKESAYPQLELDFDNKTARFNRHEFNLNPPKEEVAKNIRDLKKYFDTFDECIEDGEDNLIEIRKLKRNYWKILNYMFLSPFLAYFRYFANKYDYDETTYPIYLLVNGESGIGKTTFIRSVQKLMTNELPVKYVARNLKKDEFESFKIYAKGLPILIDEMDNERWGKLKNTVKADDFLFENHYLNHPCFIMPSNNITFLDSDIQRRVLFFKIDVRLDETKCHYASKKVKQLQREFSNAFYCEYLMKMFFRLDSLIEEMKNMGSNERWIPDIYKISSETLLEIFRDTDSEIPSEFEVFSIESYKGNSEKFENAKRILTETYGANREIFEVQRRQNLLQIDFNCYTNDYRNRKNINILLRDLPRSFRCEQHGMKLTMNLAEFTKFTGIKIKQGLFH
ncbi:MAG: ATP-binding protein [Treponema sp.]|nr:ATP-binding protein [Treponema sp.]